MCTENCDVPGAAGTSPYPASFEHFKVLFKTSSMTDVPTGHTKIGAGGAVYDDERHQIFSVAYEENCCKDVFLTRFVDPLHGSTERIVGGLPFSIGNHSPVSDGKRYVYCMEHSWDDNGKRFGRFDLDSRKFEELRALDTGKKFAVTFSGCFVDDKVYAIESTGEPTVTESDLVVYDVKTDRWSPCGVKLFSEKEHIAWRLLSDAQDKSNIYIVNYCEGRGLYRINLASSPKLSLVQLLPTPSDGGTCDCILVRDSPAHFCIIAVFGGSFYFYSSLFNSWAPLQWAKPEGRTIAWNFNYLVYSPSWKAFYYHSAGKDKWEIVQMK